jgi:hypothetical protein
VSFSLLSRSNSKIVKGEAYGYMTFILHLAPGNISGYEVCAKRSAGCTLACLNKAGHGGMFKPGETTNVVQKARIRRTRFFFENRVAFMEQLYAEITRAIKLARKKGMIAVFRLNGTSDLRWSKYTLNGKNIFEHFPDTQFYDYTAIINKAELLIPNYHLTFSAKEDNDKDVTKAISLGMNVAVVFDLKKRQEFPKEYLGLPVVSFDNSDLRFLDPKGVVGGLYLKGNSVIKNFARSNGFAKKVISIASI